MIDLLLVAAFACGGLCGLLASAAWRWLMREPAAPAPTSGAAGGVYKAIVEQLGHLEALARSEELHALAGLIAVPHWIAEEYPSLYAVWGRGYEVGPTARVYSVLRGAARVRAERSPES